MPVDIKHLKESIAEAERFLNRAKACLDAMNLSGDIHFNDTSKSAAVRRSSMDLTRALAQLRKT